MPVPVDPVRYLHESADDDKWKFDMARFTRDVAAALEEVESRLKSVERRVN